MCPLHLTQKGPTTLKVRLVPPTHPLRTALNLIQFIFFSTTKPLFCMVSNRPSPTVTLDRLQWYMVHFTFPGTVRCIKQKMVHCVECAGKITRTNGSICLCLMFLWFNHNISCFNLINDYM